MTLYLFIDCLLRFDDDDETMIHFSMVVKMLRFDWLEPMINECYFIITLLFCNLRFVLTILLLGSRSCDQYPSSMIRLRQCPPNN